MFSAQNLKFSSTRKLSRAGIAATLACAMLGLGVTGCPLEDLSDSESSLEPFDISEPLVVNGDMFFVNRSFEEVIRLRPERSDKKIDLKLDRAPTGKDPGTYALSADQASLYIVNEELGQRGASLSVFETGADSLAKKTIKLDSAYDRLSVDPAGEFLLLSFTGSSGDFIARNLNELGIIDLRDGLSEGDSATFETLSSRARGIAFAPPFEFAGEPQRLAVALSPSEVTIIDLLAEDAANRLRKVPLTISQADQVRNPVQAIFDVSAPAQDDSEDDAPNAPESVSLYLLSDHGGDITRVTIQPSVRTSSGRKFDLSVNELAAGTKPRKMQLLKLGAQGTRLLVIDSASPRFTLIDVESGESANFSLPMTQPATDILLYQIVDDQDPDATAETRVLAWSNRSNLAAVIRPESIPLNQQAPTLGRAVEAIRMDSTPERIEIDEKSGQARAIVRFQGLYSGFSILDLQTNNAIPIQGAALGDIFFGEQYAYGLFRGESYLGIFDLSTGHPSDFELPAEGKHIYLDEASELIVVQHRDSTGRFTLLNAMEPTPENARVFNHIFLENLFEQELP